MLKINKNMFCINTALLMFIVAFKVLSYMAYIERGYYTIGGEHLLSIFVLIGTYKLVYKITTQLQRNWTIYLFRKKVIFK